MQPPYSPRLRGDNNDPGNYLVKSLQHDVNSAAQEHGVCALDPNLEGIPDGQLSRGLSPDVVCLNGPLVDEGGQVVAVVIVKSVQRDESF